MSRSAAMKAAHVTGLTGLLVITVLMAGCERPPPITVQRGFRGTGMEAVYNPARLQAQYAAIKIPEAQPPASPDGPRASQVFQNVKVLGDLSVGEFTRVMLAMTQWVAPPDQACGYCHQGAMSDDTVYQKVVARRMLQMVRDINSNWKPHVAATGVTCYTCHQGNPVPSNVWFTNPGPIEHGNAATNAQQNMAAPSVGLSSLPYDPMTPMLLGSDSIRVAGNDALPDNNRHSIKQTEWTYGLMMHMSQSLGVNCTYCHNTHSFRDWDQSPPTRAVAWYGIRMVRDLNNHYLVPLTETFPATRLGPTGDVAKVGCATCHKGVYKPLFGQSMAKDYPELGAPRPDPAAAPSPPAEAVKTAATAAPPAPPKGM